MNCMNTDTDAAPKPHYNNPDGTGHGSVHHDGEVPAYSRWPVARAATRAAAQPPSLDVLVSRLCPADQKYVAGFFEDITRFAARDLTMAACAELADRKFRLPSLRGHLPLEERPFLRLVILPEGCKAELTCVVAGVMQKVQMDEKHYVIWVEEKGHGSFHLAFGDRDKVGTFDVRIMELPPDAMLMLTMEQMGSLGLHSEDATLREIFDVVYRRQFLASAVS